MWLSECTGTILEREPEHTLTAKVLGKRALSQGLRPGFKYPQGSCVTQDRPLTSPRVIFGGDLCEITRVVVTIVSNDGLRYRGASLNSGVPEWGWSTPRVSRQVPPASLTGTPCGCAGPQPAATLVAHDVVGQSIPALAHGHPQVACPGWATNITGFLVLASTSLSVSWACLFITPLCLVPGG